MLLVVNWTFAADHAWALLCIAQDPELLLRDTRPAGAEDGLLPGVMRLRDATTMTTAVVIAAEALRRTGLSA